ncbi:tyrosine-type recombinase/integrase [Longirhabdus pacifica]|uniref:tyrosine-type recombinase/integrase n=1 Tax=Longirhabdus pacifica TaxID=2305227 RepID=UPI0013E899FE|nr:tyrosine-type recombinase/integrase [Longirhabdus pacifica]
MLMETKQSSTVIHLYNQEQKLTVLKKNFIDFLNEDQYYNALSIIMDDNERNEHIPYTNFTDEMMIYTFIHKPSHLHVEYDKKENTKKEYIRDLYQFYTHLHKESSFIKQDVQHYNDASLLKSIQPRHMKRYQQWLKNEVPLRNGKVGYGRATLARKVVVLKSFFKWLYEVDYIERKLHTAFLSSEVHKEDRPDRYLSYEEVKQLIDYYAYHPLHHALLTLLATTGLRIQEVATAAWRDIYYDSRQGAFYLKVKGKRNEVRHALIKQIVMDRLQTLRQRKGLSPLLDPSDDTPLFTTNRGNSYHFSDLSKYVTKIIKQTQFPFLQYKQGNVTPHWFRHYFAQEAHKQGAPLLFIQQTLAHKKVETTEIYLKEMMKKENDAAQYLRDDQY